MVTVFTPLYNRKNIIHKLYDSLIEQTNHNFEWIIIDDGSTDGVYDDLIKWNNENSLFPIIVKRVENGGKHRAVNLGVEMAKSEAFFIVDSDDVLPKDAIEFIENNFKAIEDNNEFAGISGLKISIETDEIMGGEISFSGYVDATNLERDKYNLGGDKAEVYKTSILKKYPFPEFPNEKFLSENIVWNRIARDGYKLRWFNKKLYYCDYLPGGLTNQGVFKNINSPRGWALRIKEEVKYHYYDDKTLKDTLIHFMENAYILDCFEDLIKEYFSDIPEAMDIYISTKKKFDLVEAYVKKEKIKAVSIYGYGIIGKRMQKFFNHIGVEVPYVIDKNATESDGVTIYKTGNKLPSVDSICISMKKGDLSESEYSYLKEASNNIWKLRDVVEFF